MLILPPKQEIRKENKIRFKDTLGYMPETLAKKPYMQIYHVHHQYEVIEDPAMAGLFGSVGKLVGKVVTGAGKYISKAVKEVGKIAKPVMKVIKDVGEITEDAYDAAKRVAISALPSQIRGFASESLLQLEKVVTNPVPTVKMIAGTAGEIAGNIVRETKDAVQVVYREAVRPTFRVARNVANETVWKPIHKVVDVAVLPILPKSVRDRVDQVLNIPEKAFSGKLTDKAVVAGLKATYQLGLIPTKMAGKFANDTINTLKKDAILGPFS